MYILLYLLYRCNQPLGQFSNIHVLYVTRAPQNKDIDTDYEHLPCTTAAGDRLERNTSRVGTQATSMLAREAFTLKMVPARCHVTHHASLTTLTKELRLISDTHM